RRPRGVRREAGPGQVGVQFVAANFGIRDWGLGIGQRTRARVVTNPKSLIPWFQVPARMAKTPDITSTKNPLVKRIRGLLDPEARRAEARMVVEGVRMLEEVLDAGVPVEVLVYDPHALAGPCGEALLDRARRHGARLVTAAPHVVAACSQVDTPQGVVAVVARSPAVLSDLLNVAGLVVVVADRLQDPGNLGTIIRTADAAGATAVLATHGTVDPSNPKVVR